MLALRRALLLAEAVADEAPPGAAAPDAEPLAVAHAEQVGGGGLPFVAAVAHAEHVGGGNLPLVGGGGCALDFASTGP